MPNDIPRFLICDTHKEPERNFVIHTQFPKFLAEATENEDGSIDIIPVLWFEPTEVLDVGYNARLMREMGDWYLEELNSYED